MGTLLALERSSAHRRRFQALYSDFFPDDMPAAFSNIVLANGIASAAAYFVFPELTCRPIRSIPMRNANKSDPNMAGRRLHQIDTDEERALSARACSTRMCSTRTCSAPFPCASPLILPDA